MGEFPEIDLKKATRFPFEERATKVGTDLLGNPALASDSFSRFLESLPNILVAKDFIALAKQTAWAMENKKKIVLMLGAHIIKTGVGPLLVELMDHKAIDCLAMNGACVIHDFELARFGRTSEDVAANLETGRFGYVKETGVEINLAVEEGFEKGLGYGESVAKKMLNLPLVKPEKSMLLAAQRNHIPTTVHVALGTETLHQHPEANGAAIGETSLRDFKMLCHVLKDLEGGVLLLLGSAVILPEVFLKALTVVRNLGHQVKEFYTANFDMNRHYRPSENVVRRPTLGGGKGYTILGHHELMVPLFFQAVWHYRRVLKKT